MTESLVCPILLRQQKKTLYVVPIRVDDIICRRYLVFAYYFSQTRNGRRTTRLNQAAECLERVFAGESVVRVVFSAVATDWWLALPNKKNSFSSRAVFSLRILNCQYLNTQHTFFQVLVFSFCSKHLLNYVCRGE